MRHSRARGDLFSRWIHAEEDGVLVRLVVGAFRLRDLKNYRLSVIALCGWDGKERS